MAPTGGNPSFRVPRLGAVAFDIAVDEARKTWIPRRFTAVSEGTIDATAESGHLGVARSGQLLGDLGVGPAGTRSPSLPGVVAEEVGLGGHDLMGHPASCHHFAIAIDGEGLDRSGTDIDPDRDRHLGRLLN